MDKYKDKEICFENLDMLNYIQEVRNMGGEKYGR